MSQRLRNYGPATPDGAVYDTGASTLTVTFSGEALDTGELINGSPNWLFYDDIGESRQLSFVDVASPDAIFNVGGGLGVFGTPLTTTFLGDSNFRDASGGEVAPFSNLATTMI